MAGLTGSVGHTNQRSLYTAPVCTIRSSLSLTITNEVKTTSQGESSLLCSADGWVRCYSNAMRHCMPVCHPQERGHGPRNSACVDHPITKVPPPNAPNNRKDLLSRKSCLCETRPCSNSVVQNKVNKESMLSRALPQIFCADNLVTCLVSNPP